MINRLNSSVKAALKERESPMKVFTKALVVTTVLSTLFACSDKESIAKVGSESVSKNEFETYMDFKRIDKSNEKLRDSYLNDYLERKALTQAIQKTEQLDQAKINAELEEFKKQMIISRYFDSYLDEKISEQAIRNYYASNSNKYESKKAQVAHILVRTNSSMSEEERQAKYTQIHQVYSQLNAGKSFDELAEKFSEDTISSKKGGVIGWINQGAIDPVFSKKVFEEMESGAVSEPFQSSFGFHIVKLIEGPSVVKQPLERVKGDIRHQLRKEAKKVELERLLSTVEIKKG
ncbi:peptidylprolyl isomerase [Pleionea sediminis]|uniref:peptidylprolyl isomerase n=1 Tax=Pleionea sediminis TaxID=2569479 RepID=UPI001184B905|nr:peptidylprolyl isomerase [Pleionea sediminis]